MSQHEFWNQGQDGMGYGAGGYSAEPHSSGVVGVVAPSGHNGADVVSVGTTAETDKQASTKQLHDDEQHKLLAEIDASLRKIEAISPEAAKNLPRPGAAMSNADLAKLEQEVAKTRDEIVAKDNMEKAQKIVGLATGAAFLGSVLGENKERGEKSDNSPDSPNKNDRFEKLLSALGGEGRKLFGALGGGKNVSEGELLSVQNNLPDLMAASRNVDVRSV